MPASGPSLGSLTKGSGRSMNKDYSINLSVQQVLSLWVQGTVPTLQHFTACAVMGLGETGKMQTGFDNKAQFFASVSILLLSGRELDLGLLYHIPEMWYWVFLWCLFSSLLLHGTVGLLMLVALQRHRRGRLITLLLVSVGFLASLSGAVITSAAVAGVYRVAGKDMAPLEALVFGVGQTALTVIISLSRILATL